MRMNKITTQKQQQRHTQCFESLIHFGWKFSSFCIIMWVVSHLTCYTQSNNIYTIRCHETFRFWQWHWYLNASLLFNSLAFSFLFIWTIRSLQLPALSPYCTNIQIRSRSSSPLYEPTAEFYRRVHEKGSRLEYNLFSILCMWYIMQHVIPRPATDKFKPHKPKNIEFL